MHYAIIAAGEGSRLRQEGVASDKPLVPIQGQPMIDRLIGLMLSCHAESISVICNSSMPAVCQHLRSLRLPVPLHLVEAQTPSSMHSLARLAEVIPEGKVCVTTVDTIFQPDDFAAYIEAFEQAPHPLFVVTPFVEDEKPLWVTVEASAIRTEAVSKDAVSKDVVSKDVPSKDTVSKDAVHPRITAFCDARPDAEPRYVSGGIYGLHTRTAWPILRRCLAEGQSRMRNYQRALLSAAEPIHACVFDCVFDIDHAADIHRANAWLTAPLVAVTRTPGHSPNNVAQDAAILRAVTDRLVAAGHRVVTVSEDEVAAGRAADVLAAAPAVVHMARTLPALSRLAQLTGPVLNAPRRVIPVAGSREYVLSMLHEAGVSVPAWWAYDPEADEMFQCDDTLQLLLPGWVKATRPEGARPDDVTWVETPLAADARVIELAAEAVPDIVVTRHVDGDLLKAYCVGDGFLQTFYPQETGYSKFGEQEQHNTPLRRHPYSREALADVAQTIACTLGLDVFGFDAIIGPDGHITVIDVNDWPSFSRCREEAAAAIASMLLAKMQSRN